MPTLKLLHDGRSRLFIDPASISSGWAWFVGNKLMWQGTVLAPKKDTIFSRLLYIWECYKYLILTHSVDEVHIEKIPRSCHQYTIWSVAIIGTIGSYNSSYVSDDIWISSWQKITSWRGNEKKYQEKYKTQSEDEAAAICMGLYYLNKLYVESEEKK